MLLSVNAMHPFVQLKNWMIHPKEPHPFDCPWIMMSPPGLTPRFLARARSSALGYEM
jgi:hypothetical protein